MEAEDNERAEGMSDTGKDELTGEMDANTNQMEADLDVNSEVKENDPATEETEQVEQDQSHNGNGAENKDEEDMSVENSQRQETEQEEDVEEERDDETEVKADEVQERSEDSDPVDESLTQEAKEEEGKEDEAAEEKEIEEEALLLEGQNHQGEDAVGDHDNGDEVDPVDAELQEEETGEKLETEKDEQGQDNEEAEIGNEDAAAEEGNEDAAAEEGNEDAAAEEGNEVAVAEEGNEDTAAEDDGEQTKDVGEKEGEGEETDQQVQEDEAQQQEESAEPVPQEGDKETEAEQVAEDQQANQEQQETVEQVGQADEPADTEDLDVPLDGEHMMLAKEQSDVNENATLPPDTSGEIFSVPPAPHLPSPERTHTSIEGQMSTSALNVVWSFGLNRNVPVLNLSDGVRQAIMYPCAHVGIMYDFKNNKQHSLQAHLNPITCSAISQDKRWLVTGDVGPDAMVNIWDTYTGTPIQTMFDPNPSGGVVAVALTPDSRYLATLSALPVQTLAIWDWTVDGDVPICSADLKPEYGLQNFIYIDPTDIHHVVTNSETQVLFYHWEDNSMQYFAPPLSDSDFNKPVGRYSQSLFQIGIARALTATSIGNLVVWDNNKPLSKFMDVNQSADKKPLKIIKVHDKGINVLTSTDNYIVVGDTAGHVKFFDQGLRLIYWYQDFHSGPCTAVSFAYVPDFVPVPKEDHKYPSDSTKQAKPFVVRDFVVGTAIAVYGNVNTNGSKFKVIHREHDAAVHALAAHPKLPIMAMGSYSGLLKLWNYRTKEVVASRMFEKLHIHSCAFDPKGFYLVVGCTNGALYIVDSVALLDQLVEPFRYARDTITHIAFSHNSSYFATADAGCTITVYKRQKKESKNLYMWHGRYRSHYKPIKDLTFGIHLDTNEPKLMTLGEDRMLIEYDLHHVGKTHNHVVPCAQDRIEQAAIPQCMTWYPPITKEHFLLTANDQFKLKCYNSTTKMCRQTVLGPTYGSPIRKMMVVPTEGDESSNRFLAYITDDKVGLHILPASGNPHLAMALIAHPSGVSNLTCSFDGAYLFTAGGPDFAVHMWEINIAALEAQAKLGGEDLIPFYGLLEGGRDGDMFAELEDLFYYAQLRHQGINCTESRQIGSRVPISEVPYIMRAMGFYPSEQEIEDMLNEIKYDEYVNLGQYQEDIDLGRFIKLYINHRPAFGLSPEKLLSAFQTLAESPELGKGGIIERGDLLELLQKKGEHMTEYELAEHLTTLLGFNQEGGSCEQEQFEPDKAGTFIAENLPYDINAEIMINEILGFSMTVDPPGPDDTKDVIKSTA